MRMRLWHDIHSFIRCEQHRLYICPWQHRNNFLYARTIQPWCFYNPQRHPVPVFVEPPICNMLVIKTECLFAYTWKITCTNKLMIYEKQCLSSIVCGCVCHWFEMDMIRLIYANEVFGVCDRKYVENVCVCRLEIGVNMFSLHYTWPTPTSIIVVVHRKWIVGGEWAPFSATYCRKLVNYFVHVFNWTTLSFDSLSTYQSDL